MPKKLNAYTYEDEEVSIVVSASKSHDDGSYYVENKWRNLQKQVVLNQKNRNKNKQRKIDDAITDLREWKE